MSTPDWCAPWCTRAHSTDAAVAELCESEPVTLGLVRFEETDHEGWMEVSAETLHDFTRAISTRSVTLRATETMPLRPEVATALGVALIQAAALHNATAAAVTQ